ncbi:hypothetical protein SAMN05444355_11052 [Flavobacterium frigoris]|uniref:Uncharacterized protein n=1 Tax=Flavobacterium frigoris TaxID=229204 RepID=A0A1H9NB77_FLAFI|nr:hypothetical protein SAMN05444355_11052 [Flavobacterium frigoris]
MIILHFFLVLINFVSKIAFSKVVRKQGNISSFSITTQIVSVAAFCFILQTLVVIP